MAVNCKLPSILDQRQTCFVVFCVEIHHALIFYVLFLRIFLIHACSRQLCFCFDLQFKSSTVNIVCCGYLILQVLYVYIYICICIYIYSVTSFVDSRLSGRSCIKRQRKMPALLR